VYHLTVTLDATLNSSGTQFASSLSKVVLYKGNGDSVKTATGSGASAQFELSGFSTGDYFVGINDLSDLRIPVRITSLTKDLTESVAMTLDNALIYSGTDNMYRVKTYSKSQGGHPLVKYSDGNNVSPEATCTRFNRSWKNPMRLEVYTFNGPRMVLLQVASPAERISSNRGRSVLQITESA